jgi:hypothetical protein
MEIHIDEEIEIELDCPHCKKHIVQPYIVNTCVDIDMSDYAPDYSWRD